MDAPGVPLAHYIEHQPGFGVRFECNACQACHDVEMGQVLDRLRAIGRGPGVGVRELARIATKPCARCGAMRWETRPARPPLLKRAPSVVPPPTPQGQNGAGGPRRPF